MAAKDGVFQALDEQQKIRKEDPAERSEERGRFWKVNCFNKSEQRVNTTWSDPIVFQI